MLKPESITLAGLILPQPVAFLFDLDGTLVNTVQTRIGAWLRAFEEYGIPTNRADVARLIGSDGRYLARVVAKAAGQTIDAEASEAIDCLAGAIYSELNTDPQPVPGVRELLQSLEEQNWRWAIATSSRPEQVGPSIQALTLSKRPTIFDGSHVEHAKPAPDLLLFAARELRVEPSRIWYTGDAVWDMQAARAAGMPAIGIPSGSATAKELVEAGAWLVIDNLSQLLPLTGGPGTYSDKRRS